jgi:hypothetical protein
MALTSIINSMRNSAGIKGEMPKEIDFRIGVDAAENGADRLGARRAAEFRERQIDVMHRPAGDDAIEGEQDERREDAEDADALPGVRTARQLIEGLHRRTLGGTPDREFAHHNRHADHENADEIDQNENAAAVFARDVGEFPDISESDRGPGTGEQEADPASPMTSFGAFRHRKTSRCGSRESTKSDARLLS